MKTDKISSMLNTRVLGRNIIDLEETDSTNSLAIRMIEDGSQKEGQVIIAEKQTAGKGRHGRNWFSDGGLCLTVLTETKGHAGYVSLTAGLGVAEGLASAAGRSFYLKYPNDIFSERNNGKKIGGILAQSKRGWLVVGIGINIDQSSFPAELADTATSMKILGVDMKKETATAAILNSLEPWLDSLKKGNVGLIRERWLKLNCTIGGKVFVKDVSPIVEGTATGLDEDGSLIVETANGPARVTTGGLYTE